MTVTTRLPHHGAPHGVPTPLLRAWQVMCPRRYRLLVLTASLLLVTLAPNVSRAATGGASAQMISAHTSVRSVNRIVPVRAPGHAQSLCCTFGVAVRERSGITPRALGAAVSLTPGSLTFSRQAVGSTSTARTVTLTNTGVATMTVSSISITGTNPADFIATGTCATATIAPDGACTIGVRFAPTAAGSRTAQLSIVDDAAGSPQTVPLTGTGSASAASLLPGSLSFGSQLVGTGSITQSVILTNTGNMTLTVSSMVITGANSTDFVAASTCVSTPVAPGGGCVISVRFAPSAAGNRTALLSIVDDAAGSPQTVPMSGTGVAPVAGVSATNLTFGNQALTTRSSTQTVTLRNSGTAPLTVSSVTMIGANAVDFSEADTCAGVTLAINGACTIGVRFAPTGIGSRSASLLISDNAADSPQGVILGGTGINPVATLTTNSLSFKDQLISTLSSARLITVTNTGTTALAIASVSLGGSNAADFVFGGSCAGTVISSGASCVIAVAFAPNGVGSRMATLSVIDNAPDSPQSVSLLAAGINPATEFLPGSLNFDSQQVGTRSTAKTVYLLGSGSTPLQIAGIAITGTDHSDFTETDTCAGTTLAPNASCMIAVRFAPTGIGVRQAILRIIGDMPVPEPSLQLTGSGTPTNTVTTATQSPGTGVKHQPQAVPLTITVSPHVLRGGQSLTITVRTAPRARISAELRVVTRSVLVKGTKTRPVEVTVTTLRYYLNPAGGVADRHGRYIASQQISIDPKRAVQGQITVTARTPQGTVTRTIKVTIDPPAKRKPKKH